MPFIPHTDEEVQEMLNVIEAENLSELFDEVPSEIKDRCQLGKLPKALTEMELSQLMSERAKLDTFETSFLGAGAYEHYIPSAVWQVTTRGEWLTAYTPYQAEASQGTLELLYEFQTMIAELLKMEVSNASMYDGASSLAEAILMACRCQRKHKEPVILVPSSIHPNYREVLSSILKYVKCEIVEVDFDLKTGRVDLEHLEAQTKDKTVTAVVIPGMNFFGVIEDVDTLTDWAQQQGALAIGLVNPLACSLLKPPGDWGEKGADIACGEGQVLGIPLSSGGPYFGLLCCKEKYVRQIPGRIVGKTTDLEGKEGYTLTLQAREQHIRRAKATSNICTNQGLMTTAASIYMSLMGPEGLKGVMRKSYSNSCRLKKLLLEIEGIELLFKGPTLHEFALKFDQAVEPLLKKLCTEGIIGGLSMKKYFPSLGETLLVCCTETKTEAQLLSYVSKLKSIYQGEK